MDIKLVTEFGPLETLHYWIATNKEVFLGTIEGNANEKNTKDAIEDYLNKKCKNQQIWMGTPALSLQSLEKLPGLDLAETIRKKAYDLYLAAQGNKWSSLGVEFSQGTENQLSALVEGLYYASYQFDRYKSKKENLIKPAIEIRVSSEVLSKSENLVAEKGVESSSINLCRDLVNTPGGDLTPQIYTQKVRELFSNRSDVNVKIRTAPALAEENFMGLLTVGRGSQNPPVMISLSYEPKNAKKNLHLALVGKGVTFDTGGISIKPATGMWEMRMDMGGSAMVLGAFDLITKLKLPIKVTTILCLAENRPGENACLPGDIFKAKNGKTIMVDNTDAEGRLVLSDGLCEAEALGATHIVDAATLTGAIIRAIGPVMTGGFSNDDDFIAKIIQSGKSVGEKIWHMPLEQEYAEELKDKVADLKNIGGDAGAVTAALFLSEFVEKAKWAHLDIAGTAFTNKPYKYYGWGATGWGVKTLTKLAKEL